MATNNTKATKATKATTTAKATKGTDKATTTDKPVAFAARKQRQGVALIEAAGGNAAKVTIVTPPRMVVGGADTSRAESCLAMLRKSATIGEYLAARDKAGLGATLGGYLPGWVEKGYVQVGKANAKPAKASKGKANAKPAAEPAKV